MRSGEAARSGEEDERGQRYLEQAVAKLADQPHSQQSPKLGEAKQGEPVLPTPCWHRVRLVECEFRWLKDEQSAAFVHFHPL